MEETSEDDEIARKRARYACTFRPESSVLLYDSMYRVCCVYINVVVVFSSDLGIFEYFNIRILGRYIRTNSKTMLAALHIVPRRHANGTTVQRVLVRGGRQET